MALTLELNTNETHDFCVLYDALSPLRKRIWDKIVSLSRQWTHVIPSQSKIALWCKCSRSAVSEAFKLFKEYGWMHLLSRGWKKSKTICIHPSKRQIDPTRREYFSYVKATYRATHTYSYRKSLTSRPTGEIAIPQYLQKLDISLDAKLKLSLVPEYIYRETVYQCQKLAKTGFRPESENEYFVGTAIKMAQNKGLKLDWRSYYETKAKNL